MLVIIFVVLFYVNKFLMMNYINKILFNKCPLFTIKWIHLITEFIYEMNSYIQDLIQ